MTIIQTLALAPALAARPFLTAFVVAATPYLISLFPAYSSQTILPIPAWLTLNITLFILGILALLEAFIEQDTRLKRALEEIAPIIKIGVALLISFSLIEAKSTTTLQNFLAEPAATVDLNSGLLVNSTFGFIWSLIICVIVWLMATVRKNHLVHLFVQQKLDQESSGLILFGESLGVIALVILVLLTPPVGLVAFSLVLLGIYLVPRQLTFS